MDKTRDKITSQAFKKYTQGYTFKVLLLFALVLLLLIPLGMIRGLVNERGRTAASAESDIMEAWGKQLVAAGPIITIPGIRTSEVRTRTERDGAKVETVETPFTLVISPQKLDINTAFKTETRKRGIFSVPLFSGTLSMTGTFDPRMAISELLPNETVSLNQAELVISLSSQKGIRKINTSNWDNQDLFFKPGNRGYGLVQFGRDNSESAGGIYATLPAFENKAATFTVSIDIQGGQSLRFLPIGQDTHVDISADWPSPSFQGAYLPGQSAIDDTGFSAIWDVNYLSRNIPLSWKWKDEDYDHDYTASLFGVDFFRAINTYALNTRAVKYAVLFLIVPFLTLFLLEIFTKKRIHPVPYLLSGIGNAIFYLLLLSLSEQMPFYTAYLLAALAVTAMMTLYSRSLLPSWSQSWYMGLVVTLSYVLLYAVLNAESYALLIGSVGTFAVTALIMFLTRKLDWYSTEPTPKQTPET
ncbi:MAG: cell envelope integrity protein CreD [Spirochaetaceae bacterium]|jgi:inner membrane protein|nr:cell envelope integrity protein CreD [Spirochaetaceae bacterium]